MWDKKETSNKDTGLQKFVQLGKVHRVNSLIDIAVIVVLLVVT